jgi:hypothetical protein
LESECQFMYLGSPPISWTKTNSKKGICKTVSNKKITKIKSKETAWNILVIKIMLKNNWILWLNLKIRTRTY